MTRATRLLWITALAVAASLPVVASAQQDGYRASFVPASYSVGEGAGSVRIVVRREGPRGHGYVSYATADGSAKAGSDFDAVSGQLHYFQGDEEMSFTVPIRNDTSPEGEETFSVVLTDPAENITQVGPPARVAIGDDDSASRQPSPSAPKSSANPTVAAPVVAGSPSPTPASLESPVVFAEPPHPSEATPTMTAGVYRPRPMTERGASRGPALVATVLVVAAAFGNAARIVTKQKA